MDLLFKRYASPFLILDQYIQCGTLIEFALMILKQREEDRCWELYLSIPLKEKGYNEFRDDILNPYKNVPTVHEQESIVNDSFNLIDKILGEEDN